MFNLFRLQIITFMIYAKKIYFEEFMSTTTGKFWLNSLRPRLNRRPFADDIFNCILLNENEWILPRVSLKFVPKIRINNIPALVQIMGWRRPGDKPLSEPMMVSLLMHICVTRPQWVKCLALYCRVLDQYECANTIGGRLMLPYTANLPALFTIFISWIFLLGNDASLCMPHTNLQQTDIASGSHCISDMKFSRHSRSNIWIGCVKLRMSFINCLGIPPECLYFSKYSTEIPIIILWWI